MNDNNRYRRTQSNNIFDQVQDEFRGQGLGIPLLIIGVGTIIGVLVLGLFLFIIANTLGLAAWNVILGLLFFGFLAFCIIGIIYQLFRS